MAPHILRRLQNPSLRSAAWLPTWSMTVLLSLAACSGGDEPNQAPVAKVAALAPVVGSEPWAVWAEATLTLDSSDSSDADGDALTHQWQLVARPVLTGSASVNLTNVGTARPQLRSTVRGDHLLLLTVADGQAQDTRAVTVSVGPSYGRWYTYDSLSTWLLDAGPDRCTTVGGTAAAAGRALPASVVVLGRRWTVLEAPSGSTAALGADDTDTPTLTPEQAGVYVLQWRADHEPPSGSFTYVMATDHMTVLAPPAHPASAARAARSGLEVTLLASHRGTRPDGAVAIEVDLQLHNPTQGPLTDAPLHLLTAHGVELLPLGYLPQAVAPGATGVVTRTQRFVMASGWQPIAAEYAPSTSALAFDSRLLWCIAI